MKSRVSIDVDYDNQPIVRVEYVYSDDVRDKLVKLFLEGFAADSAWSKFQYLESGPGMKTAILRPIHPFNLKEEAKTMNLWAKQFDELYKDMKPDVVHSHIPNDGTTSVSTSVAK